MLFNSQDSLHWASNNSSIIKSFYWYWFQLLDFAPGLLLPVIIAVILCIHLSLSSLGGSSLLCDLSSLRKQRVIDFVCSAFALLSDEKLEFTNVILILILKSESEVAQSCLTLCDPMDCSPQGSSVHGILQARILKWVAISFSRGSSWPRDQTQVSRIAGRRFNLWSPGKLCNNKLNFLISE